MRFASIACVLASCAVHSTEGLDIPCATDDECPTGDWCSVLYQTGTCTSAGSPPHIVMDGIAVGSSPFATTIKVPSHVQTTVRFGLRNDGGHQASIDLKTSSPTCLGIIELFGHIDPLDPGKTFSDDLLIDPAPGCASPAKLAFTATGNGRRFDFSFDVTIGP
ncbi:MAG: hypothetical protein JWO36_4127 [Myxococcales bacterium]|nr:hypothetical protein [Myxococcales bacterium]